MFDDDEAPKPRLDLVIGEDLSSISVEELEERITTLEGEISRLRAEIVSKRSSMASAESFFKS